MFDINELLWCLTSIQPEKKSSSVLSRPTAPLSINHANVFHLLKSSYLPLQLHIAPLQKHGTVHVQGKYHSSSTKLHSEFWTHFSPPALPTALTAWKSVICLAPLGWLGLLCPRTLLLPALRQQEVKCKKMWGKQNPRQNFSASTTNYLIFVAHEEGSWRATLTDNDFILSSNPYGIYHGWSICCTFIPVLQAFLPQKWAGQC